jgi:prolyl-tRNA synthetase
MRFSKALLPTVKEPPADATSASHALLTRAGFIRRVGAGIYEYLPLGVRVLHKIETIVRREMDRAGAQEVLMPALIPAEYFKETGRWDLFGDTLLRLRDRKGADFHLGPTHEEIITDMVRREIKSYRDLPKNLYQIQTKFRDEARPRGGLLRCREFLMKDAYSFDTDEKGALESYEVMRAAYQRIFDAIGLTYRLVAADSGAMGGSTSAEFQVLVDSGEDAIVACSACDYAANVEAATVKPCEPAPGRDPAALARVHTPGHGTIADVTAFLSVGPDRMLKSLLYVAKDGPLDGTVVMCVVRGDHDVNEVKLAHAVAATEVFLATEQDIERATGAKVGFAGPVGFGGTVVADHAASIVIDGVTGANETDYHVTGVNFGRDYQADVVDVRLAHAGDSCPRCDAGVLQAYRGIEGGHIFVLGTHYSAKMGATFLDEKGETQPVVMGCYGIGVSRLLAATVEQHNDADGIIWPSSIAPYDVEVVAIGSDAAVQKTAAELVADLEHRGVEVLWDDRDERPGVKFKDADLIGIPLRVMIGQKGLAAGGIELRPRHEKDPKKTERVPVADAARLIAERVRR